MYIIKNAFKCIARSKGRNVLIGIIALVIAVSVLFIMRYDPLKILANRD